MKKFANLDEAPEIFAPGAGPGGGGSGGGGAGGGGGHGGGGSGGGGGGGGHGGGGSGGGGGGGSTTGDLYGDQYIFLRDLDPAGGGGNGELVLDTNGNPVLVGSNGEPIYYVLDATGSYVIPEADLPYAQTVELERANVARAPDKVMDKSLGEALAKVDAAASVTVDPAGRLVCDGATIDSPLENLALYKYLMTNGGTTSWSDAVAHADQNWPPAIADLLASGWDPSSLLGAAFAKETPISMDAVIYENTTIGVNGTSTVGGNLVVDYYEFTAGGTESYNYDRAARFGDMWLSWYQDIDGDPTTLEQVTANAFDAVFGDVDANGVPIAGSGHQWEDVYMVLSADGQSFVPVDATNGGLNDWAASVDDSRAMINFIHSHYGAVEVPQPTMTSDLVL